MSSPHPVHPGNYLHYPSCLRLGEECLGPAPYIPKYIYEQGDHGIKVRYPWLSYLPTTYELTYQGLPRYPVHAGTVQSHSYILTYLPYTYLPGCRRGERRSRYLDIYVGYTRAAFAGRHKPLVAAVPTRERCITLDHIHACLHT